jgi:hypothetical protein
VTSPDSYGNMNPALGGQITSAYAAGNIPNKGHGVITSVCGTGLFALTLLAGTGGAMAGSVEMSLAQLAERTSSECRVEYAVTRRRYKYTLLSTPEKLSLIRDQFSLNFSDLSKVLRISRPTLYSWIRDDASPHEQNLTRIEQLYVLAMEWHRISAAPVGKMRRFIQSGSSLIERLSQPSIHTGAVRETLVSLQRLILRAAESKRGRKTITDELIEKFGFPEPRDGERQSNIEEATGFYAG